jgi:hypothetical protein
MYLKSQFSFVNRTGGSTSYQALQAQYAKKGKNNWEDQASKIDEGRSNKNNFFSSRNMESK